MWDNQEYKLVILGYIKLTAQQFFGSYSRLTASGLVDDSEAEQVSMLLYSMGGCADDILATLSIDETTATYQEIVDALNDYYGVRRNVITERVPFNRRKQAQGESIDAFI